MSRVEQDTPRPSESLQALDLSERIFSQGPLQTSQDNRIQATASGSASSHLPGLELSGVEHSGVQNVALGEGTVPVPPSTEGIMLAQAPTTNPRDILQPANTANDASSLVNTLTGGRRGNNPFFAPSSGPIGLLTGVDVTPLDVAGYVANAWDRVSALNDVLSGQRPQAYSAITFGNGQPVVVGRPQDRTQTVNFVINNRSTPVDIDLPGFRGSAVTFATDGRHIIAIDPRNNDMWMLQHNVPRVQIPIINPDTYSWTRIPRR